METDITKQHLTSVMYKKSGSITQDIVDNINKLSQDSMLRQNYKDNIIGFASVLDDGRFRLPDYINAVRYVSFKLLGDSNVISYRKTFPDRITRLEAEHTPPSQIASFVGAYNRTKLVQKIMAQTLTPQHVLNMDLYQSALNVQAELMLTATSEKVKTDAANSLLVQLRQPELKKIDIAVKVQEDSSIEELRRTTLELAEQQRLAIINGKGVKEIAHSKLSLNKSVVDNQ